MRETNGFSKIYVSFIDILFAVVLGQSFALLNSQDGFRPWLVQPIENAFGIVSLLLVYGLIITSWIGYHRSTQKYPIKSPYRFVIDVILLFIYYLGLVNAGDFNIINWVFFFSFLLYTFWDIIRIIEYLDEKGVRREHFKRTIVTLIFCIAFLLISYCYPMVRTEIEGIGWAFFAAALFLLVLYRVIKRYK